MKLVAVSQRVDAYPDRQERRDALDQRLVLWLKAAGYLAVPVPNLAWETAELSAWLTKLAPCAILLSGGNDLGEAPERDHTETLLLHYGASQHLPLLGICRGMQMLLAHAGARLQPLDGHVAVRHPLLPDSLYTGPWPETVNSFHRRGVRATPPGYAPLVRAADGSIEAMRHETLPWEGWMWHPEREPEFSPADIERLRRLIGSRASQTHSPHP